MHSATDLASQVHSLNDFELASAGCVDVHGLCVGSIALIVGLTVMGILVVSGIITIVCCCMRRRAAAGQVIRSGAMGPGGIVVTSESPAQCQLCNKNTLVATCVWHNKTFVATSICHDKHIFVVTKVLS